MKTLLYLPLDERFATRDAFLHLASLTPFKIISPPKNMLPAMKNPPDIKKLHSWLDKYISEADYLVLSAEIFLYGGLINSRLSKENYNILEKRLLKLKEYKEQNPDLKIYLSTVIMRIPSYNLDIEEPAYWKSYGRDIFLYSFYTHKYHHEKKDTDKKKANSIKEKIPEKYLNDFLWRRKRNHKITQRILDLQKENHLFEAIYITLDDNAPYGFNKMEEEKLRKRVKSEGIENKVNIYPGADEVGLTMLAKIACEEKGVSPSFQIIYRDPSSKNAIPNYEGQPLKQTVYEQIIGAGGVITNSNADIYFLVNNFKGDNQLEAMEQKSSPGSSYNVFDNYIKSSTNKILALADVRYSNGGDISFFNWLKEKKDSLHNIVYAGWNTCGNSLGTVVANAILLALYNRQEDNTHFNTIRLLEDLFYQSIVRNELMEYINKTADSIFDLSSDLNFYHKFVYKRMLYEMNKLKEEFSLPSQLKKIYFPWQRTFEIGLELEEENNGSPRN